MSIMSRPEAKKSKKSFLLAKNSRSSFIKLEMFHQTPQILMAESYYPDS